MDVGRIAVDLGLLSSIAAIILYIIGQRRRNSPPIAARIAYSITVASVLTCFFRLMWLIFHQRYEYKYVFDYSSPDLRFPWTVAATWAGQEGSFLLWSFWTSIIGGLVAWKAGKWETRVMPIYISVITFLMAILLWLNPFEVMTRATLAGYPTDLPWPPSFGKGLNPSLQNYWMAIHPPTIFFGFASLAVPFCFALAAMKWKDYGPVKADGSGGWAGKVIPWVLMTVATLGVGLFMGGYWAYETQGWHGFWAWDPVENASLFPWLGALGLLHGLVVEKSRGGMARTNIFLAILSWLAFLWGTYLTRSGALSDFSFHSFVSLASRPLDLLKWMIGGYGVIGLAMLAWRWKDIPGRPVSDKALSRDTALVIAVSLMVFAAVIVGVATSWPMLSRIGFMKSMPFIGKFASVKGMAAQPTFYNKFSSIILIPTLLAMGSVPFLAWGKTNSEKFLTQVIKPWFVAIAFSFGVLYFVLTEATSGYNPETPTVRGFNADTPRVLVIVLAMLGLFVIFANAVLAVKILRAKTKVTLGGWMAHVGFGLIVVGAVLSNVYEKTQSFFLVEGEASKKTEFGYQLQFVGWSTDGLEKAYEQETDPKKQDEISRNIDLEWRKFDHAMKFKFARNDSNTVDKATDTTAPSDGPDVVEANVFRNPMKITDENQPVYYRWPYIHREPFRDVYVSIANDPRHLRPSATLKPGQSMQLGYIYNVEGDSDNALPTRYSVFYKNFRMEGDPGKAGTIMRADIEVTGPDGRIAEVSPGLKLGAGGPVPVVAQIPSMNGAVTLKPRMDVATKAITVEFEFNDAPARWVVPIQITNKPMINMVWSGVIISGLGTLIAMFRRSKEVRKGKLISEPEGESA